MRRIASRFLLVGLAVAVIVLVVNRLGRPGDALVVMESIRAESDIKHEAFRVEESVRVTIEAAGSVEGGEAGTTMAAHGWLVHRETGRVAWQMRPAQRPSRGTFVLMRDTLALEPGTYDAYFAALGVPEVRVVRQGTTIRERLGDALSGGGKAWGGDANRWRFLVRLAPGEDRGATDDISNSTPEAEGLVWGTGPARSNRTHEVTLRATAPVQVRLDALFEATDRAVADSAYLVSVEGDTLWTARFASSQPAGGSVRNRRQTDTLSLAPGRYRAIFRADGSHAFRDWEVNPPWEPWRWGLRIAPADSASRAGAIAPEDPLRDFPRLVDFSCVDQDNVTREGRFEVTESLDVLVIAVGEFVGDSAYDYAVLTRENGGTVWDMRQDSRERAGGARKNVRAEEFLTLTPGQYALRYTTDSSHHCQDYNSGTPDDETFWGVVLLTADGEEAGDRFRLLATETFTEAEEESAAPASGAIPEPPNALARLVGVGDDQNLTERFQLSRETDVCVLALGEMNDSSRYDWGAIEGPTSWEMTEANSFPAGGATLNRMAVVHLTLPSGAYTARFRTDTNHSAEEWVNDPPPHPDLWGIQVWPAPEGSRDLPDPRSACLLPGVNVSSDVIPPPPASVDPAANAAPQEPDILEVVEQQPELIGGLDGLQSRVEYPEAARRAGVEGKVFVQFVVSEEGRVSQAVCARSPDERLCDAAIAAVQESQFRPGIQRGRPVRVRYTLPVDFRLI